MQISSIIEARGAKFDGIQKVKGKAKFALATDPQSHSTHYLLIKGLNENKVRTKLAKQRKNSKINVVNL
ncbi:MAG: hypothetical protein ACW990_20140 [Promethearchaeota archaeon]|jgi:hypothetical protein